MGPVMTRLAGEIGDGWISHELCSPAFLRGADPARASTRVWRAAGRAREDIELVVSACAAVDADGRRPAAARPVSSASTRRCAPTPTSSRSTASPTTSRRSSTRSAPGESPREARRPRPRPDGRRAHDLGHAATQVRRSIVGVRRHRRHDQAEPAHARTRARPDPRRAAAADRRHRRDHRRTPPTSSDRQQRSTEAPCEAARGHPHHRRRAVRRRTVRVRAPGRPGCRGHQDRGPVASAATSVATSRRTPRARTRCSSRPSTATSAALSLDLNSPRAGRRSSRTWCEVSDVVYSNLRGDVPAKIKILYDDLKHLNPQDRLLLADRLRHDRPAQQRARLRLHPPGPGRLDGRHRRARRPADQVRSVDGRLLRRLRRRDRAARRRPRRAPRRRRHGLRRLALRHRDRRC